MTQIRRLLISLIPLSVFLVYNARMSPTQFDSLSPLIFVHHMTCTALMKQTCLRTCTEGTRIYALEEIQCSEYRAIKYLALFVQWNFFASSHLLEARASSFYLDLNILISFIRDNSRHKLIGLVRYSRQKFCSLPRTTIPVGYFMSMRIHRLSKASSFYVRDL